MKKIICCLLSAQLMLSVLATPIMAASDAYLTGKTVYFDTTRIEDVLAKDTKIDKDHFTDDSSFAVKTGFKSVYDGGMNYYLREDTLKGNNYIDAKLNGSFARFYFDSPKDCTAGDRYIFEFSVKAGEKLYVELAGVGDTSSVTKDFSYHYTNGLINDKKNATGTTTNFYNTFTSGEWYHIVAEIVPGESLGNVHYYVNGTKVHSMAGYPYTVTNFNRDWAGAFVQISGAGGPVDDIRFYKTTEAYNATTAGDVASVTSTTLSVEGNKIKYAGKITLSGIRQKVTAAGNGTIAFATAADAAITDETAAVVSGTKVIVRAASGVTYKVYTLEETNLVTSGTYTIANGVVRGITGETSISDFLGALTSASTLSVEDMNGNPVTDGNLSQGMKLVATADTGITRAEYDIDCANLTLIGPDNYSVTKLEEQEFEASFIGVGTTEFYVNGNLHETTETAPHKTTVNHYVEGNYTVYAKVTFQSGAVLETERITYTYAPNQKPVVTIGGAINGDTIGIDDTLTLTVNATDPDVAGSVVEKAIYVDGVKQVVTDSVVIGPLAIGRHEIYAEATDNEGGVGKTNTLAIKVVKREMVVEINDDFADSTHWSGGETVTLDGADQSRGNVYKVGGTARKELDFTGGAAKLPVEGYVEMDFRHSDPTLHSRIFLAQRSSVRAWDESIKIDNGKLGSVDISPNVWYSLRIYYNAGTKTIRAWVKDNTSGEYILAKESTNMDTDGALGGIKMDFCHNDPPTGEYSFEFDNYKIYYYRESTVLDEVKYLNSSEQDVFANNEVGYDVKKIELHFNNEVSAPEGLSDGIKVYANNVLQTGYTAEAEGKVVTITFSGDIKTLSNYRIDYSGIQDKYEEAVSGSFNFRTSAAEYDCLEWTVKKSDETVQSLNNIAKGDVLTLTAMLSNKSTQTKNSTLVFAVYSGKTLVGSSFTSVSLGVGQTLPFTSIPLTVSDDANGDLIAFGYVWEDSAARNIEIQRFIMSD